MLQNGWFKRYQKTEQGKSVRKSGIHPKEALLARWAAEELESVRAALPREVGLRVADIPVMIEPEPGPALIADGVEPDVMGLFVGSDFEHERDGRGELPSQIFLFLNPLWAEAGGDPVRFREEVRRTYLHEIGHYLGWEEADLSRRDLE